MDMHGPMDQGQYGPGAVLTRGSAGGGGEGADGDVWTCKPGAVRVVGLVGGRMGMYGRMDQEREVMVGVGRGQDGQVRTYGPGAVWTRGGRW